MKYSIIIPVYNAETYLGKCLDSILRQGLKPEEYEVLLVDDGSTDNSVPICERYCNANSNFRLISQANSGVSAARNRGIEEADGEFIIFVDADDYLLDNGLNIALNCLDGRDDVDVVNYISSYDFWEKKPIDKSIALDGTGHELILQRGIVSFCWLFAYKKDFLNKHDIRFSPYIVGEDQLFTASVLLANPRLIATNADIYRYVVHESSATTKRSESHSRRCVDDYLNSYSDILSLIDKYNIKDKPDVYQKCIDELNFKKMFGFSRILSSKYNYREFRTISQQCKDTGFYPVKGLRGASTKSRLQTWVMNQVLNHYPIYLLASFAFNQIIVPYIMPRLRVNL